MKQLSNAILLYAQDYDEGYPISIYVSRNTNNTLCVASVYTSIVGYHKSNAVMICPSDPSPMNGNNSSLLASLPPPCTTSPATIFTSYQPNFAVIDQGYPNPMYPYPINNPNRRTKRVSDIEYPSDTALLFDGHIARPGGTAHYVLSDAPVDGRHRGLMNLTFTDGHAKTFHTRPTPDSLGNQVGGNAIDGQAILDYTIMNDGPYYGNHCIYGIAHHDSSGNWLLTNP